MILSMQAGSQIGVCRSKGIRILRSPLIVGRTYDIPAWILTGRQKPSPMYLDNAVKYTPSGGTVSTGKWHRVSVVSCAWMLSDNGIGIPEEEQAQIFNRFYRGKYSTGVDGVGIGLYLTRDIMTKQKGYIKVISNDTGTTFSLFFRLYVEE